MQVRKIDFLTDYWGLAMGAVEFNGYRPPTLAAALATASQAIIEARRMGLDHMSCNLPSSQILLAQGLQAAGFYLADCFIPMEAWTKDAARRPIGWPLGTWIREAFSPDLDDIERAYRDSKFPNRFVSDGFNREKAYALYGRRFREVYEKQLGKIFVADIEGAFAGAIIAIVDTETNTNPPSGLGLIVAPECRGKGVGSALVEYRQGWYYQQGVERVSFGASFNNAPMLRCLERLGFRYGGATLCFHRRL